MCYSPTKLLCNAITMIGISVISVFSQNIVHYDECDGISSHRVSSGIQDHNGLLWFATQNGINCYDGYEFHSINIQPGDGASISTNHIRDILLSDEGNIICHTDDDIYEYDLRSYAFKNITGIKKDSLKSLVGISWKGFYDIQGNFWFADKKGLYKNFSRHHPAKRLAETENSYIRSLLIDRQGRLLVGSRSPNEIKIFNPDFSLAENVPLDAAPYCMFERSNGDIWVGGKPMMLQKINGKNLLLDAVYDITEDSRGWLWIATFGDGIKCCTNPDDANPKISRSLGGYKVRKILITPSDNLIAATTDGLLIGHIDSLDCMKTEFKMIKRNSNNFNSLCSNSIMSVATDSKGNIYISTESSGIETISEECLFSDNPQFRHFNTKNSSLTSDISKAMTMASDSLMIIVGNNNIMAFNTVSSQTINFSKTFWGDSCRFTETTPAILPDGSWLFGSENGAFLATDHNINSRGYIPPLVFTTLAINGESVGLCMQTRDRLELKPGQRNISVHFAAIDFVDNRDILYSTRFDGSPWTKAGRMRNASLFNLTPGEHTLEVQSTDRYGRWGGNGQKLSIFVEPYWHETWWAKLTFSIILLCIFFSAAWTYIYIRKMKHQRRELLEKYMSAIKSSQDNTDDKDTNSIHTTTYLDKKIKDSAFLNRIRKYIEENISNPEANVDGMAAATAASRSTLNRHLRSQLGISAAQLLIDARMQRAEQLIKDHENNNLSISDIAAMCGYCDVQYFQRVFKKKHGRSISEYIETRT